MIIVTITTKIEIIFNVNITSFLVNLIVSDMSFQIFVKNLEGKTVVVEVSNTETVFSVKQKLGESHRIDPNKFRLTYMGSTLFDLSTMGSYHLERDSTLYMFPSYGMCSHCLDKHICNGIESMKFS